MIIVFLFNAPQQHLVQALSVYDQKGIAHLNKFVEDYKKENGVDLIRAVLGKNSLVVLNQDEDLHLPTDYAQQRCIA